MPGKWRSDPIHKPGLTIHSSKPRTIQLILNNNNLSIFVVLFFINNMYVNPQLANYIHTRSLSASICWIWPDFGLHWWPSSCEHIYFQIERVCSDNYQRNSSSLTYSPYTINHVKGFVKRSIRLIGLLFNCIYGQNNHVFLNDNLFTSKFRICFCNI